MREIDIQPDAANDIRLIAEYTIEKFGMEQARIYADEMEKISAPCKVSAPRTQDSLS
ncbi:MAG: hypothetical protein AAFW82_03815 [Pseudomonadota bacterium]